MRMKIHKPQEATPSVLQPKILNFDNPGSLAIHHEIMDPNETFVTANNRDPGNSNTNNKFTTNSMDLDRGLSPVMAKELQ